MALINCPECGKEISDKATNCPHCGYPISEPSIPASEPQKVLCCPKCQSQELHAEQKGFSGGKAVVGAVLFGGVGLLAGAIGSKDVNITCLKCGNRFKAGEARIVISGKQASDLEKRVISLLCDNQQLQATTLYKKETNCSLSEAYEHILKLQENEVPKYITPEQQARIKQMETNSKANNSGCAGIVLLTLVAGTTLLLL